MHVLILGGTRFAGRAVADAALERGDTVTLFNRGRTNPGLYPQAETIIGDRTGGARQGLRGVFNVTGEPIPFGRLLDECVAGTGSRDADLRWVPSARLLAAGVDPWMGVPLRVAAPGWEAANDVDVSRPEPGCCTTAPGGHVQVPPEKEHDGNLERGRVQGAVRRALRRRAPLRPPPGGPAQRGRRDRGDIPHRLAPAA